MAVVVGYVPTKEGRAALQRAAEESHLRSSKLVVVSSARGGRDADEAEMRSLEQRLDEVKAMLADAGIEHEERQYVRGNEPAEDLVAVANEVGAEVIVIGLRRRTPVGKLLLGSNAQRILLEAACPVLAVKASDQD